MQLIETMVATAIMLLFWGGKRVCGTCGSHLNNTFCFTSDNFIAVAIVNVVS